MLSFNRSFYVLNPQTGILTKKKTPQRPAPKRVSSPITPPPLSESAPKCVKDLINAGLQEVIASKKYIVPSPCASEEESPCADVAYEYTFGVTQEESPLKEASPRAGVAYEYTFGDTKEEVVEPAYDPYVPTSADFMSPPEPTQKKMSARKKSSRKKSSRKSASHYKTDRNGYAVVELVDLEKIVNNAVRVAVKKALGRKKIHIGRIVLEDVTIE